jgi:hypothetical protein
MLARNFGRLAGACRKLGGRDLPVVEEVTASMATPESNSGSESPPHEKRRRPFEAAHDQPVHGGLGHSLPDSYLAYS